MNSCIEIGFQYNNNKNKGCFAFDRFTRAYSSPILYYIIVVHNGVYLQIIDFGF